MSVRGEFRRILADVVAELRGTEVDAEAALAADLDPLVDRAVDDLSRAAEETLALLPRFDRTAARAPLADAAERLEAVCRSILGR